jgi:predicted MFS family arabinose efflux permease
MREEMGVSADVTSSLATSDPGPIRSGAFAQTAFTVIWTASMVSNVGIAMFDTASGWFMANLSANPMDVSLVQVATSLPLFLFTLPAGALTDIVDPRRLLLYVGIFVAFVSAVFATLVSVGVATPHVLLLSTFLLGVGGALSAPAWVSITPLLVPRQDLDQAVSVNTVGYNLSRAVGPALGGLVIAGAGIATPFWVYAATNIVVLAALLWWRPPEKSSDGLPAERLSSAIRTGIRHAKNNPHLRATLGRAIAFFPFASAYWALLPLVARAQMTQGPEFYGLLLGAIGLGAIGGSLALARLKAWLGPDGLVAAATLGTAAALVMFGLAHDAATAVAACLVAGATWTLILSTLYVSAQVALPDWVRGRGLAIFLTAIFGASTIGSAVWGHVAGLEGLSMAHYAAAAGALAAIPLTWRLKLQTALGVNLAPSLHWRLPQVAFEIQLNAGPVLVSIEYSIAKENQAAFLNAMEEVGRERKRDGAYAWRVFEDITAEGKFVEIFLIESWLELMHQRERVTAADRMMEDRIRSLLLASPRVTHMIAPRRERRSKRRRVAALCESETDAASVRAGSASA